MKTNMATADRLIRILVAIVIGVLYFTNVINGTLAIVLLILSGVFIITGLVGFCPLYAMLGLSSGKSAAEK